MTYIAFIQIYSITAVLQVVVLLLQAVMDPVDIHNKGMEEDILNKVATHNREVTRNKEVIILLNNHNKHTEVNKDTTDNHNHNPFMYNNHKKVAAVQVLQEPVAVLVWPVHVYVAAQRRWVIMEKNI